MDRSFDRGQRYVCYVIVRVKFSLFLYAIWKAETWPGATHWIGDILNSRNALLGMAYEGCGLLLLKLESTIFHLHRANRTVFVGELLTSSHRVFDVLLRKARDSDKGEEFVILYGVRLRYLGSDSKIMCQGQNDLVLLCAVTAYKSL